MDSAWTLSDLARDLSARGDRDALFALREGRTECMSGADLADRVRRLAAGLIQDGFEPKEPLAVFAPSSPQWLIARLAIGVAGGVAAPIDDLASDDEAAAVIADIGCRRIFTTGAHAAALRQRSDGRLLRYFLLEPDPVAAEGAVPWQALLAPEAIALPRIVPEDPAMIAFTSGTTAAPKSFVLTHANIAACLAPLLATGIVGPADRVLLPLPLHHVYPFVVGALAPLSAGACVVFPQSVSARHLQFALQGARTSVLVGVPRLFAGILSGIDAKARQRSRFAFAAFGALEHVSAALLRNFGWRVGRRLFSRLHAELAPDLRAMISGGAHLDAQLAERIEALGWEVFSGYGLAECSSVFTGNRPGRKRIDSEGLALTGELRIGGADARGVGEIQLRGANVFVGYRNNPDATNAAFTPDGWFRTGDLGYLDRDGYLYVTGRAKEVIVLGGGKKVLPEELEKVYAAHPHIREIALLEQAGVLCALVVPHLEAISGAGAGRPADAVRVALAEISSRLPPYQRVAGFALTSVPLPRTRLGKYRRFLLPELYARAQRGLGAVHAELSRDDRAFLEQKAVAEIWHLLEQHYRGRPLALDASPQLDLGIDSLEAMALSLELDTHFGVQLSEQVIAAAPTIRDLVTSVLEARSAQQREMRAAAADPADLRWLARPSAPLRLLGWAIHALNRGLMRFVFRLEAKGVELLPVRQAFVLAVNHASDLDPPIVAAALPRPLLRRLYWGGAASRIFHSAVLRLMCRSLRIFPVDDRKPGVTLALGAEILKRGQILAWFPEEWRSPTGALQAFRPGVGYIVKATGAAAVPALIEGSFEAWPRQRRWPRFRPVGIRFGRPHSAAELAAVGTGVSEAERIADGLRQAVAALQAGAAPCTVKQSKGGG